jgi:hypothetical protein
MVSKVDIFAIGEPSRSGQNTKKKFQRPRRMERSLFTCRARQAQVSPKGADQERFESKERRMPIHGSQVGVGEVVGHVCIAYVTTEYVISRIVPSIAYSVCP